MSNSNAERVPFVTIRGGYLLVTDRAVYAPASAERSIAVSRIVAVGWICDSCMSSGDGTYDKCGNTERMTE